MLNKHELWAQRMGLEKLTRDPAPPKPFNINDFRIPEQQPWQVYQAELKRKQDIFGAEYKTEKDASDLVRRLIKEQGWTYEEQVRTISGKAIDYVVTAWHEDREIKFGIEVKRQMSDLYPNGLAATTLADHLEQAAAYARDLNMPVFLGPVQSNKSPSSMYTGGKMVDSVCALNIFGGRMNVGTLIVSDGNYVPWFMILRGSSFFEAGKGFNEKRLNMVTSTGSKKERTDI
jgi:hypothetical protein